MTVRCARSRRSLQQEDINFLLTNRIPRRLAHAVHGLVQQDRAPAGCASCRSRCGACSPISTSARRRSTRFASLHACFIARAEARRAAGRSRSAPCSPARATPSSARAGAIDGTELIQAKGFPYTLRGPAGRSRAGRAPTATATTSRCGSPSSMYHRFHAPHDCTVERVTYISGDTWNINPIALKRVERLFCKNERAVMQTRLARQRPPDHAGAGRGDPGRQHPAALPRRAAASELPRPRT